MKLLHFYLCLLVILLQTVFASSSLNKKDATLSSGKKSGASKPKRAVGKRVKQKSTGAKQKQSTGVKKSHVTLLKKKVGKNSKRRNVVVVKEDKPILLSKILPKVVVEIVIGYFIDNLHPAIISSHSWALEEMPQIAVDSTRVYMITESEGLKGLKHSFGNVKEDEHHLIELGGSQWSKYDLFGSSHDGRCVFFCHIEEDDHGWPKRSIKWLMQSNDLEDGGLKRIAFDGRGLDGGILSRDGQTLCAYCYGMLITRVYQIREEAGKDLIAFVKLELNGIVHAVSGNGNRVIVKGEDWFEIYDVSKDAGELISRIEVSFRASLCALNEDGSEAAFVIDSKLLIAEVDKVNGSAIDQSAIAKVKIPDSLEALIIRLVYSDGGKLHAFDTGGNVSLYDPSTKELIISEAPQKRQLVTLAAISPNADCIAFLKKSDKVGKNGKAIYRTVVKGKLRSADLKLCFGYEA